MPKAELEYDDSAFTYFAIVNLFARRAMDVLYGEARGRVFFQEERRRGWGACWKDRGGTQKMKRLKEKEQAIGTLSPGDLSCAPQCCWVLDASHLLLRDELHGEIKRYDPFEILRVEPGATPRDLKRAYRKLSLLYHPDKNPDNEDAAAMFMKVRKAYEALTDEDAKRNYELFGNPDGRQALELSIGLPSIFRNPDNHNMILLVFLLVLVVIVPLVVWKYWSWSRKFADNAVLTETLQIYLHLSCSAQRH